METKNLTNAVLDGVVDFANNSMLNIFQKYNYKWEKVFDNEIKVFIPLLYSDDNMDIIKNEEAFKNYLNADLHYLIYLMGMSFVYNEIIDRFSLYYLINNKIIGSLSTVSFNNDNDITFSLLSEETEFETIYQNVCTFSVYFEKGSLVIQAIFPDNVYYNNNDFK